MDLEGLLQEGTLVAGLIRSGVVVVGAFVVYWFATRIGRKSVEGMAKRGTEASDRAHTLWLMIRRTVLLVVVVSTVLALLQVWGISIGPFLAVGALVGAAVGFGAQDVIKDVLAGFFILLEDQFRVGDVVTIAGTTGVVEDIQFRVTKLRDLEGNVHYVPNGQITVASNLTSLYAYAMVEVGVAYSVDVDRAMEVIADELEALAGDPEWSPRIRGEAEVLGLERLEDSAVVLRARLQTVAHERWGVRREALRRLKKRFESEGITIPFPQVTVHRAD